MPCFTDPGLKLRLKASAKFSLRWSVDQGWEMALKISL